MVIAIDDRNAGLAPDAPRSRRALSAVLAINALILKRIKLAGIKRPRSPGAPVAVANLAAGASACAI